MSDMAEKPKAHRYSSSSRSSPNSTEGGAVLYLHPAGNSGCGPLIRDVNLNWMVGAPIEDRISTMQLITRGIPSRFPHMRVINSHLGGALPMLLQRADDQYASEYP